MTRIVLVLLAAKGLAGSHVAAPEPVWFNDRLAYALWFVLTLSWFRWGAPIWARHIAKRQ
ncbi:MAG: hypothetical protein V3T24_03310 [Longimicrobiales bacterium]